VNIETHRGWGRLVIIAVVGASVIGATPVDAREPLAPSGIHGFDFEFGSWTVHHRMKRPNGEWIEFDGTCRDRPLIDGSSNVEEHRFVRPSGVTHGIALRAYDAKTDKWAIWWVDSRDPHAALDPPVKGRFVDGTGTFTSDTVVDGVTTRTRFVWSHITANSAR